MRVTANMSADNSIYNIQQGQAKLNRLQELAATGYNVNRPSDDPINTRLLLDLGDKIKEGDQYLSNTKKSETWLNITSTALTGMSSIMTLAKQQAATIASGTSDLTERQNAVLQFQALKQQIIDMGNIQSGDQYVFGGAKNTTPPFSSTSPYYAGDDSALNVEIGNGTTQQMNLVGSQLLTADTASTQPYGTTNVFKAFDELIAAVTSNDVAGIVAASKSIEAGATQINNAESDVASRLTRLDTMTTLNENTKNTLLTIYGDTQNVDLAKVGVELTQQKTAFEATLAATAKVSSLSLLDYL